MQYSLVLFLLGISTCVVDREILLVIQSWAQSLMQLYMYKAPQMAPLCWPLQTRIAALNCILLHCCTWSHFVPYYHCTTGRTRANPDRSGYVFVHQATL